MKFLLCVSGTAFKQFEQRFVVLVVLCCFCCVSGGVTRHKFVALMVVRSLEGHLLCWACCQSFVVLVVVSLDRGVLCWWRCESFLV